MRNTPIPYTENVGSYVYIYSKETWKHMLRTRAWALQRTNPSSLAFLYIYKEASCAPLFQFPLVYAKLGKATIRDRQIDKSAAYAGVYEMMT